MYKSPARPDKFQKYDRISDMNSDERGGMVRIYAFKNDGDGNYK
jgi:hypothetical protein